MQTQLAPNNILFASLMKLPNYTRCKFVVLSQKKKPIGNKKYKNLGNSGLTKTCTKSLFFFGVFFFTVIYFSSLEMKAYPLERKTASMKQFMRQPIFDNRS